MSRYARCRHCGSAIVERVSVEYGQEVRRWYAVRAGRLALGQCRLFRRHAPRMAPQMNTNTPNRVQAPYGVQEATT